MSLINETYFVGVINLPNTHKDYVLERTLPNGDEESALKALETFLAPRIQAAEQGKFATRTVDEIFAEAEREKG